MSNIDESTSAGTTSLSTAASQKKQKAAKKSGLPGNHGISAVWTHFDKLFDDTGNRTGKAKCKFCNALVHSPSYLGTNNLWTHLRKCFKYKELHEDKTQSIIGMIGGQASVWMFDQSKCRNTLARMIILCELPFSFVDKEGFKLFCADLQPRFHVVSRTTITKDCLQIYHGEKNKLKEFMKSNTSRVSITTDMWTSNQNLGYMVLTAHFIDKDWTLHKKIINFKVLPHPHKGEAISKAVESCLLEWGINKVMTITLDNAKNNDTCVMDLKRRLNNRNMSLLFGEFFHVRCFAHIINLVVRDGIDEVKMTIKRLRRSVKFVRSSPSRLQIFKQCVLDEGITNKRLVCLDVKTRWNSTYLMINAALGFEKAFARFEDVDLSFRSASGDLGVMGDIDWKNLRTLHTFLEDFYLLTVRISGSHYVTSNTYFDELSQAKNILMCELYSEDVHLRTMAMKMNAKFDKYCAFDRVNPILVVAIILDPRYKVDYVSFWYRKYLNYDQLLSEDDKNEKVGAYVESMKLVLLRLYQHYKSECSTFVDVDLTNPIASSGTCVGDGSKRARNKDEFRAGLKRKEFVDSLSDLDKYLNDGVEDEIPHFNVLAWWKEKMVTYRSLAIMARDILSIPITSVASESAFSTAGRVLDPFRSSLTPNIVESLICTQDWLKSPTSYSVESVDQTLEELEEIEKVVTQEMEALALGSQTSATT